MINLMRNEFDYEFSPVNIEFTIERYINVLEGKKWASKEMVDKINIDNYKEFSVIFDFYIGTQGWIEATFAGMKEKSKGENTYLSEVLILHKEYCMDTDTLACEEDIKFKLYIFLREMHWVYNLAGDKMYGKDMHIFYRYCDLRREDDSDFFGIQDYKLANTLSYGHKNDFDILETIDLMYKKNPVVVPF